MFWGKPLITLTWMTVCLRASQLSCCSLKFENVDVEFKENINIVFCLMKNTFVISDSILLYCTGTDLFSSFWSMSRIKIFMLIFWDVTFLIELGFMSSGVFLAGGYSSFCFMDVLRILGLQETLVSSQSVSSFAVTIKQIMLTLLVWGVKVHCWNIYIYNFPSSIWPFLSATGWTLLWREITMKKIKVDNYDLICSDVICIGKGKIFWSR